MDALTILQKIAEVANMGLLEVTIWLIIMALFVWLHREFKTQYQNNKDLNAAKTEKSMANIS